MSKLNSSVIKENLTIEHLEVIKEFMSDWSFFLNQEKFKMRLGQYIIYSLDKLGHDVNFPEMFYYEDDEKLELLLWEVFVEVGVCVVV